ncbi:MAG: aminotransferase class I/II-fold pyridoxal phosphate-dependent enzyme [bacterium]|nr:aminotransferase class I/II-fold pyridoxal phosphate-dependent enzyme [Gammaproteobacteria bacterium]
MKLSELSLSALHELYDTLSHKYEQFRAQMLNLDLTRGKPASEQLDLSNELDGILGGFYLLQDGTDVRNYGGIPGIPEARALGGVFLGLPANEVMVGGNSSLTWMYQYIEFMLRQSWQQQAGTSKVKFLCPVPGYDRHFTICEHFGIEMINVDTSEQGPDMGQVESLLESDPMIKGIWCVPKYSNPTGVTYSDEVVRRMATLANKAGPDFKIMWDNAYAVHHINDEHDTLANLMDIARENSTQDSIVMLASTSKVTFAGAGISFIGMAQNNLASFEAFLSVSQIGPDKVNQLRHVRFLVDSEGVRKQMEKHKAIIRPKFQLTEQILSQHLGDKDIATWTRPNGGYFVSLDTQPGIAGKVVEMAAAVGVKLTPAGATFPYGNDPADRNIRIAPTYPPVSQLRQALEVFVVCLQLTTLHKIIGNLEDTETKP